MTNLKLLLLTVCYNYVKSTPDEYCLTPLNTSDCGVPPTPVFSYYKYGSRCDIMIWRGCPTNNMFENEYHCSGICVGKTSFYGPWDLKKSSFYGKITVQVNNLSIKELEDTYSILENIKPDDKKDISANFDDINKAFHSHHHHYKTITKAQKPVYNSIEELKNRKPASPRVVTKNPKQPHTEEETEEEVIEIVYYDTPYQPYITRMYFTLDPKLIEAAYKPPRWLNREVTQA